MTEITKHHLQLFANLLYMQKMYFKSRSPFLLRECKKQEELLFKICETYVLQNIIEHPQKNIAKTNIQQNLFNS